MGKKCSDKKSIHNGHRQRLKIKVEKDVLEQLTEHEFLENLLYFAIPRKNTNEIAHALIRDFGTLRNVFEADKFHLMQTDGVTENVAHFIITLPKFLKRISRNNKQDTIFLNNQRDYAKLFASGFAEANDERFYLALTRENNSLITLLLLDSGDTSSVNIDAKEVMKYVLKYNATKIALAHNHPNNICKPSKTDLITTANMVLMFNLCGVQVVEHLIFGTDGYTSIIRASKELLSPIIDSMDYYKTFTINQLSIYDPINCDDLFFKAS